jgi:hypothetical protein
MSANTPENPAINAGKTDYSRDEVLNELRRIIRDVRDQQSGETKKERLRKSAPMLGLTYERAQNLLDGSACMSPSEETLTVLARYARFTMSMERALEEKLAVCRARNRLLARAQPAAGADGAGSLFGGAWSLGLRSGRLGGPDATQAGGENS